MMIAVLLAQVDQACVARLATLFLCCGHICMSCYVGGSALFSFCGCRQTDRYRVCTRTVALTGGVARVAPLQFVQYRPTSGQPH